MQASSKNPMHFSRIVWDGNGERINGVRVVVQMRRVEVGKLVGGYSQAVGIRCRKE